MQGLRPLGVGELLDAALKIYRSRAKTLLAAVAVPVLPVVLFSVLVSASAGDFAVDPVTGELDADGGDVLLSLVGSLVSSIAIVVATSVATAACFRSISGAYVGDDPDWRESLRFGFSRMFSVIGLTIITVLATVVGLLFCLVGALWPLTIFAVAMPVLLVEDLPVFRSMGRSRELVRGTGWRVLGIVLLGTVIASIFQAMIMAPLALVIVADVGIVVETTVNGISQMIATVLVTPFTAALTMALYVDLRVRKEGFDLYLWSQRLGVSATDGFPTQPGAPELPPGWGPAPYPVPGGFGGGGPQYPPAQYPPAQYPPQQYPPQQQYPPPQYPPAQYPPQQYPPQYPPPPPPAPGGGYPPPPPPPPVAPPPAAPSWGPPPAGPDDPTRWNPPGDDGGWSR